MEKNEKNEKEKEEGKRSHEEEGEDMYEQYVSDVENAGKKKQEPQNNKSYAPEIDEWVKEKPMRNYIRLKSANEQVVVRLKNRKPDSSRMDDFNGKAPEPVPVYTWLVTTPDKPDVQQEFDVTSKRLAADIMAYYDKGFSELEITRLNTNPVSYRVVPIVARQAQHKLGQAA